MLRTSVGSKEEEAAAGWMSQEDAFTKMGHRRESVIEDGLPRGIGHGRKHFSDDELQRVDVSWLCYVVLLSIRPILKLGLILRRCTAA